MYERRACVPRVGLRKVRGAGRRARARAPGRRGARGRDAEPGLAPAVNAVRVTRARCWCQRRDILKR